MKRKRLSQNEGHLWELKKNPKMNAVFLCSLIKRWQAAELCSSVQFSTVATKSC